MTTPRPNLVFVLTDEQKATGLDLFAPSPLHTPALERLAAEGLLVEQAFTPCPLCVPSRATIFTGRYPRHHGLWFNDQRLAEDTPTWLDALADAGYELGLFGKSHCLPRATLDRLFDTRFACGHEGCGSEGGDPGTETVNAWLRRPELMKAPWAAEVAPFPASRMPTHVITEHALRFLRRARRPFLLWLSYPDPHTPLQCPEPYASLFPPEALEPPAFDVRAAHTKPARQSLARTMFGANAVEPDRIRRCMSIYYGMQRFIDDELGRVLDELDSLGPSEDTLVVFTSDHGDYMGEHGLIRKSLAFYDALIRVPLVMRFPGRLPAGTRYRAPASLVDLAPSILDLLGLEPPDAMDGHSLVRAHPEAPDGLRIANDGTGPAVFGEAGLPGEPPTANDLTDIPEGPLDGRFAPWGSRPEAWTGRGWMIRSTTHKLVEYDNGEAELYDLAEDPGELENRHGSASQARAQADLAQRLARWRDAA